MSTSAPPIDENKSLAAKLLRPKVAIPLLILFLVLVAPFLIRGWYLHGVPDTPEPFDATGLLEYSVPDDENAFNDYQMAFSLYIPPSQDVIDLREQISEQGWSLANDDVRQFLYDNEAALRAWKQGTGKEQALYIPAKDYTLAMPLDFVQQMRELHRTVMLLCRKLEAEGKPLEAWEWYRAEIRASRHAGAHGGAVERRVGIALWLGTAQQLEAWAAHPDLTADDLRRAAEQIQTEWQQTAKPSTAIQFEYLATRRALGSGSENMVPLSNSQPVVASRFLYVLGEPTLSQRLNRFLFHNQLEFCDLPRYQRPSTTGIGQLYDDPRGFTVADVEWSSAGFQQAIERAILIRLILPGTSLLTQSIDRAEARYRTLLVVLAGQAFRRDHGRFPNTLDELVPEYLDEIPIDNYDGKPLKYRFDPDGPVVYSIFENLSDDGGVEWNRDTLPSGQRDPDDYGSQLRLFQPEPLAAPRPVNP